MKSNPHDIDVQLSALLARAEKAEAHADELDALLNEGIATDEDTRRQARNAALREAAAELRDYGEHQAVECILALLDAPDAGPMAAPPIPPLPAPRRAPRSARWRSQARGAARAACAGETDQ